MAGNFFRGVSAEQDGRYVKVEEKRLAKMTKEGKFPPNIDKKVDFDKVNIEVLSRWVSEKITQLLGSEDEILVNLVVNALNSKKFDPKKLQVDITGFLNDDAKDFMQELWDLALDAQIQPSGIPSAFIKIKKEEILKNSKSVQVIEKQTVETKQNKWNKLSSDIKSKNDESKPSEKNEITRDSRTSRDEDDRKSSRVRYDDKRHSRYDDRRSRSYDRYEKRKNYDDRDRDRSRSKSKSREREHKKKHKSSKYDD